jgi:fucose permease
MPSSLPAWRNAVFALFFISGFSLATWFSRVPTVRDSLGLSTAEVGILIFGLSAGSVLGLVAAVWLLGRFGASRAMAGGLLLAAGGLVLLGVGTTLVPLAPLVFVALAFVGFGMGSVDVMMNVEGAAAENAIGKTLMPLMHGCFSLGTVAGALVGAGASFLDLSVFLHLSVIAVIVAIVAVAAVRFIPQPPAAAPAPGADGAELPAGTPTRRARLTTSLQVWRDRRILLIGVIVLGMAFAEGSANDWLALAAVDGHGLSNTEGAVVFGVFVAAMTVGRFVGGPVIDRFGRVRVLQGCAVVAIAGLTLFILAPGGVTLYLGVVLWGLGASLGFPVGMSAAADDRKNAAARVSAVAMIGYLAFLVGPPVLGLLGEQIGILYALGTLLVLMVLAALAAPAAREQNRPARTARDEKPLRSAS